MPQVLNFATSILQKYSVMKKKTIKLITIINATNEIVKLK